MSPLPLESLLGALGQVEGVSNSGKLLIEALSLNWDHPAQGILEWVVSLSIRLQREYLKEQ